MEGVIKCLFGAGYSHSRARGRQEPLQSVLSAGNFQLVGQQREDGVGAAQAHTVHHHRLNGRQLGLTGRNTPTLNIIDIIGSS